MCAKSSSRCRAAWYIQQAFDAHHSIKAVLYGGERKARCDLIDTESCAAENNPGHAGGVIDLRRRYYGADVRWSGRNLLAEQREAARQRGLEL